MASSNMLVKPTDYLQGYFIIFSQIFLFPDQLSHWQLTNWWQLDQIIQSKISWDVLRHGLLSAWNHLPAPMAYAMPATVCKQFSHGQYNYSLDNRIDLIRGWALLLLQSIICMLLINCLNHCTVSNRNENPGLCNGSRQINSDHKNVNIFSTWQY